MKRTISGVLVLALGLAAEVAKADFTFGEPTRVPNVSSSSSGVEDWDPDISTDGLSLFFGSNRPGGEGVADLWVSTRPTIDDPWGAPVNLGPTVNSPDEESDPSLSADGLTLYFKSSRPGGFGGLDLWFTTRPTIDDTWAVPVNLGPTVNSPYEETDPSISADGLSLYFCDWSYSVTNLRPGGLGNFDIWVTTRKTIDEDWGPAVNPGAPLNTSYEDWSPDISNDGLLLLFSSNRPDGSGWNDTWMTTRATRDDPWGLPVNLGPTVNSPSTDVDPCLSADGYTIYFGRWSDIWQVSIEPVVDFNGDGIVDTADMCIIVDHWGEDYSLCDIGPMPWGDGIVDVQDLIVLAEHLFEEIPPAE